VNEDALQKVSRLLPRLRLIKYLLSAQDLVDVWLETSAGATREQIEFDGFETFLEQISASKKLVLSLYAAGSRPRLFRRIGETLAVLQEELSPVKTASFGGPSKRMSELIHRALRQGHDDIGRDLQRLIGKLVFLRESELPVGDFLGIAVEPGTRTISRRLANEDVKTVDFKRSGKAWDVFWELFGAGPAGIAADDLFNSVWHGREVDRTNLDHQKKNVNDIIEPLRLEIVSQGGIWRLDDLK
jgi:hypothetical protein